MVSFLDITNSSFEELTPCTYAPKRGVGGSNPLTDGLRVRRNV